MDASCLQYALTDAERHHFEEAGYPIVEDVLTPDKIDRLIGAIDRLDREERRKGLGAYEGIFYPNFVWRDPAFVELVDYPRTFPTGTTAMRMSA